MTDIEQVPGWATAGTKTAPSSGLSSSGYTGGSQPAAANWNYLEDEDRTKINELVDDANSNYRDRNTGFEPSLSDDAIVTKYYAGSTGTMTHQIYDPSNVSTASEKKVDLAVYIDPDGHRWLMALDSTDGTPYVHLYDTETVSAPNTTSSDSGDLSADLPTGSSQSWQATSFCTDGTSVYIIFQDTNLNPNETHQIQAWDVATWNVKSGWPSTGTTLPGTGTVDVTAFESAVEVISGTQVATANSWLGAVSASTDAAVSFVNMSNGAISGSGAGDNTSSNTSANRLCSDGSYVYYMLLPGATNTLYSIDPSTPSSGSPSPDLPYNNLVETHMVDVINVGETTIASGDLGFLHYHTNHYGLLGYNAAIAGETCHKLGSLAWDGTDLWALGTVLRGSTDKHAVFKISIGCEVYENSSTPDTFSDLEHYLKKTLAYDPSFTYNYDNLWAPIVFDGRHVWIVFIDGANYKLRRIPKALQR